MKSRKKAIYLEAITLVIAGLVITSTASIIAQKPEINENKVLTQSIKTDIKPTDRTYSRSIEGTKIDAQPSNTLGTPIFTGVTPAIAHSGAAMVSGFYSEDNDNVYFSGSTDFGATWTDGVGWQIEESPELPAVDGCGDGRFIATMVPNGLDNDGGAGYKISISDPTTQDGYTCTYWTWNDVGSGYTNFIDAACGGYTAADPTENTWAYGATTMVGDHGNLGSQTGFFSYQSTADGSAWIYTLADNPGDFNGVTSTSVDIDQATLYSYAVYNCNSNASYNLLLFIMDFGQWGTYSGSPIHENNWEKFLKTPGNDKNLDISAYKNNVIIVSERDGNIIAYYANNPKTNDFSEVTIATGGQDPRISHYGENKAVCEFIKDGGSYYSFTTDGGVTWSTPKLVSEETNVQNGDVCAKGYAYESEKTIYFAPTDFSYPIITIDSISGGIGVSAVVKNIGTAAEENVNWGIVTVGHVFVGKEKSGTISSLEPGASTTVKTGLMLGIGAITITVTADTATKTATAKLLLFLVTGLK